MLKSTGSLIVPRRLTGSSIQAFVRLFRTYFSGVKIENSAALGLVKPQTFEDEASHWQIYLYQVEAD